MKAIAYIRVSTDKQEHSTGAQLERVKAYCAMMGYELAGVYEDGKSGKNLDRPQIKAALAAMAAGEAQVLVIAKLCRLLRSIRDLQDLIDASEREGWQFASVAEQFDTSTAMGRLVLNILGSVAQWEREVIAERTCAVLQHLKKNGKRWTKDAPYGFKWENNRLEQHYPEHLLLRRMESLRLKGEGPASIARQLNHSGFRNRLGRLWTRQRIHTILKQNGKEGTHGAR